MPAAIEPMMRHDAPDRPDDLDARGCGCDFATGIFMVPVSGSREEPGAIGTGEIAAGLGWSGSIIEVSTDGPRDDGRRGWIRSK